MSKIILNGITWGHSRGVTPLLAASQRFNELYPEAEIHWEKRSLQEFADFPVEKLAEQYDLLIIDHPSVGRAAATNCFLPLEQYLPQEYLLDQLHFSVGHSHQSYFYNGHQWALAIDAATPAVSYRADLFYKNSVAVPSTWKDVLALAKDGKVAVPAIPIDVLMNFYMFCIAHGNEPFKNEEQVIDMETGIKALQTMSELYSLVDKEMFNYNPITVAEVMSNTDKYWYCPFAYCYSDYSRRGFAKHKLRYADLVRFHTGRKLRSTIGGTGIAVSASTQQKQIAISFVEMVVSSTWQSTLYVEHGGQPAHRTAWTSEHANSLTNNFFRNLLPAIDNSYMRPRYNGYLHFQDNAGEIVQQYLRNDQNPEEVLKQLNVIYKKSLGICNSSCCYV
jgi:multiple sugar transport system substrate-binding protein